MNNMHIAHHSSEGKTKYIIRAVNHYCAGLDVHRDFVCVTTLCGKDDDISMDYREFRTVKRDLLQLRDWLLSKNITVAGIESTGKYWYPIYNAFEGIIHLNVYNSRHIKNIPGRKTDKSDSEWIARNTRYGELKASFIPSSRIRDTRMIARTRKSVLQIRGTCRQIVHGYLESSSIKIGSVLSDVFGVSGQELLHLLVSDSAISPGKIEQCLHGSLKDKSEEVVIAMDGYVNDVHKSLIRSMLKNEETLTLRIKSLECDLKRQLITNADERHVLNLLTAIPGVSELSALLILAEIGFDLSSFPNEKQFCSWAGLVPGKHESAGKNKTGKIHSRACYMRTLLVELSLSASRVKNSFYSAKFASLRARIEPQKAIIAIAHKIAKAIYVIIKYHQPYEELGVQRIQQDMYQRDINTLRRLQQRLGVETIISQLSGTP